MELWNYIQSAPSAAPFIATALLATAVCMLGLLLSVVKDFNPGLGLIPGTLLFLVGFTGAVLVTQQQASELEKHVVAHVEANSDLTALTPIEHDGDTQATLVAVDDGGIAYDVAVTWLDPDSVDSTGVLPSGVEPVTMSAAPRDNQ